MIQTQTLAVDDETRRRLLDISRAISENSHDPQAVARLIAQHDEIIKRQSTKAYDPREEVKWA